MFLYPVFSDVLWKVPHPEVSRFPDHDKGWFTRDLAEATFSALAGMPDGQDRHTHSRLQDGQSPHRPPVVLETTLTLGTPGWGTTPAPKLHLEDFSFNIFQPTFENLLLQELFRRRRVEAKNRTFKKKKKDFCSKTTTKTFFSNFFSNWTRFTSFFSFQNFNRSEISLVFFFFRFTRFTLLCFQRFNSRLIRSNETEARPEKNQTATLPSGFVLKLFDEYKIITVVKQQYTR